MKRWNRMYVNRRRSTTFEGSISVLRESITWNKTGKRLRILAGGGIYLTSFFLATLSPTGTLPGFGTALIGSMVINRAITPHWELERAEPMDIWINKRIEAPPKIAYEEEEIEEQAESEPEEPGNGKAEMNSETKAAEQPKEGGLERTEESEGITWEAKLPEDKDLPIKPLVKSSRVRFVEFDGKEGKLVTLHRSKESFECPLCGESVPYDAVKCPSCGIYFSNVQTGIESIILPDMEGYGNSIIPPDFLVKSIHLSAEEGRVVIYGTAQKKDGGAPSSMDSDLLAGIATIS